MTAKKLLKQIPIGKLSVGMCVVGLDISWMDSPFISKTIRIKKRSDIVKLKAAGAKKITIDIDKGLDVADDEPETVQQPVDRSAERESAEAGTIESEPVAKRVSLQKEMGVAVELRSQLTKAVSGLQDDLASNRSIDTKTLNPLIDQTLDSLERNSSALMSLAHMSRRAQKLADHCFSTFCFAMNLASFLGEDSDAQRHLGVAALLHEAGWLNIPLQLMGKRTAYTEQDLKLLHRHPELALKKLSSSNLPDLVLRLIKEHHEREDGSGYPLGIKTDQIHSLSKILAVADTYDELIHMLCDAPGMLPTNAMRQLFLGAKKGTYDSKVVESLVALLGIYPVSTAVKLNNGEKGIVVDVPPDQHLHPIVDIKYGADGSPLKESRLCNLAAERDAGNDLQIQTVLDPSKPEDDPRRLLEMDVV